MLSKEAGVMRWTTRRRDPRDVTRYYRYAKYIMQGGVATILAEVAYFVAYAAVHAG
jgi:putative flippase GtrA